MANNKTLIAVALASLIGSGIAAAADSAPQIKCWGVAKAGQNDCGSANANHSCKGRATEDRSIHDFKMMTEADCKKMNGTVEVTKPTSK